MGDSARNRKLASKQNYLKKVAGAQSTLSLIRLRYDFFYYYSKLLF